MTNDIEYKNIIFRICRELNTFEERRLGLLSGLSGIALFQFYMGTHSESSEMSEYGYKTIDKIYQIVANELTDNYSFCSGLSGIAWMIDFLDRKNLININSKQSLKELEGLFYSISVRDNNLLNYDFLHGHLGIFIFFACQKKKSKKVQNALNLFIDKIHEDADKIEPKVLKWKYYEDNNTRIKWNYNISISHGNTAIVALLTKLKMEGFVNPKIEIIVSEAIEYILKQQIDKFKYGSYFSYLALESEKKIRPSRLAWCYGDLGIAVVLWNAGNTFENNQWKQKAIEILLFAAKYRKNLNKNGVMDAGLCHGTVGIGHIFYRMWWNTGMDDFKKAADYWFEETIKMSKFPDGLIGFHVYYRTFDGKGTWMNEYNLLEGITGIGLALQSYLYNKEPAWDECLLLS
ncbi:MAG: lanthionine synthetase C family protein [Bacteroidales bacterium]